MDAARAPSGLAFMGHACHPLHPPPSLLLPPTPRSLGTPHRGVECEDASL